MLSDAGDILYRFWNETGLFGVVAVAMVVVFFLGLVLTQGLQARPLLRRRSRSEDETGDDIGI